MEKGYSNRQNIVNSFAFWVSFTLPKSFNWVFSISFQTFSIARTRFECKRHWWDEKRLRLVMGTIAKTNKDRKKMEGKWR